MKRKAFLSICMVFVFVISFMVPASGFVAKKVSDPFFGKYDKPVVVKMAIASNAATVFPGGDSYRNNVWTRAYKADLNIDIKVMWTAVDATGNYQTKLNLAIASNQLPDIMILKDYSQFERLNNAGKLLDLTKYYKDNSYPFLKDCLNQDGGLAMGWGKINGKQMGIPSSGVNYQTTRMIYIRHDYFVKTGLAKPKTMEDVLEIAKAIKNQDPDNRFALPLTKQVTKDGMCDITGISNSIGAYPGMWVDNGKGGVVYGSVLPKMKKALQTYADLYKQGMLDPAFGSIDGGKAGEQLTQGKIGVIIGNFWLPSWPLNSLFDTSKGTADWDVYPLLKSKTNTATLKVQTDLPGSGLVVVRKGFSNPEALFKMLNYTTSKLYDPKMAQTEKFHNDKDHKYNLFSFNPLAGATWGPLMTNFNANPNVTNAIDKKDTSFLKTPEDVGDYPGVKKYMDAIAAGTVPDGNSWYLYKFFYGPNSTFGIQNLYFKNKNYLVSKLGSYQTPEMVRGWINLQQLETQYFTEIIAGIRPVSDFDKFVAAWNDLGGETVTYEANDWYKTKK